MPSTIGSYRRRARRTVSRITNASTSQSRKQKYSLTLRSPAQQGVSKGEADAMHLYGEAQRPASFETLDFATLRRAPQDEDEGWQITLSAQLRLIRSIQGRLRRRALFQGETGASGACYDEFCAPRHHPMDRTTKLLLALTALAVVAYAVGAYVDCATDANCKIEMRRAGPRMIRTAPSNYF